MQLMETIAPKRRRKHNGLVVAIAVKSLKQLMFFSYTKKM